jgi:predicted DNA-binding protein (UPF0251 family)
MKFTTRTRTRMAEHVRHGRTVTVPEKYSEQVPRPPLNLDLIVRRGLFVVALAVTVGAIVWGTVAIGSMLALLAPAWAAYLVAGVFDLGWAGCLAAEWLARYDDSRARVPRFAGLVALAISMGAIVAHGALTGSLVVGIVGALVSFSAKGLWFTALATVRVKLDAADQAYLELMRRETGTRLALALSERDRAVSDARTAELRLSLEFGRESATQPVESLTQEVEPKRLIPTQRTESPQVSPVESATQPVSPEVETLVSRLKDGESLSAASAGELLGVSKATGGRRLAEARAVHAAWLTHQTGHYV